VTVTDPETGETTVREVAGTIVTEDDKHFVDLTIASGSGASEALIATTTHPFWVVSEGEWIKAGDLRPGMTLRTPAGDTVEVTDTRHFDKRQRTHDLTVTGIHAYYVLADRTPLLVHNCGEITLHKWAPEAEGESPHFSIEVSDGKTSLHTEQIITADDYSSTEIVKFQPGLKKVSSTTIRLPNPQMAMDFQRQLMRAGDLGKYDKIGNSCISHCMVVGQKGGLQADGLRDFAALFGLGVRDLIR
jgi:hypothetical protein